MKRIAILLLTSLLIFSCNKDDDTNEPQTIETTLIARDNLYGGGSEGISEQNLVISDQTTWSNLMTQMDAVNNISDIFSETDIDFSEFMVIAVFDEVKGNGGHLIDLNISSNPSEILVEITDLYPEGDATLVITQPFYLTKIAKTNLPIVFQ